MSQKWYLAPLHGNLCIVDTPPEADGDNPLFDHATEIIAKVYTENPEETGAILAAAPFLLQTLEGLNHMGGDERGGYCICPKKDGSAPDEQHATTCSDARKAIRQAKGETV